MPFVSVESADRPGILCLDIEGGWGGSSRSLYCLIEAMDRASFQPVVLTRKAGPIGQHYETLGVPCIHMPELPSFRPADRNNLVTVGLFIWNLRRLPRLYQRIKALVSAHNIRLIHVNHESFALIGYFLSRLLGLPWTAHIRTTLTPSWFSRRLNRLIAAKAAHAICIVEPVRQHFLALAGIAVDTRKISVIHNILPRGILPHSDSSSAAIFEPLPNCFRVLSLTNFSPNRGVDRIVDIAEILQRRGQRQFAFYLCGRPANKNAITGRVDPYYDSIRDRVRALGLDDMVFFPGHVSEPERALAACDALIKLTRQSNPWGRDAMEALAAGLPVITLGTFQGFVENAVNGYIAEEYRPDDIADYLQKLAGDPARRAAIAAANKAKAERLFSAPQCARAAEAVFRSVLAAPAAETQKSCAA